MTASTGEGTPLRHNGTDWAATDLSVWLSVTYPSALCDTKLSACTVRRSGLLILLLSACKKVA